MFVFNVDLIIFVDFDSLIATFFFTTLVQVNGPCLGILFT